MPGKSTGSKPLTYVGVGIALLAVGGTLALGWEWGGAEPMPMAIGVGTALLAIGWTLYSRRR